MSLISALVPWAGQWTGTNVLHDPNSGSPDLTASTLVVTPVALEKFVRLDYTWSYHGEPKDGSVLVGLDPSTAMISAYWVDSWHNGHKGMLCSGQESGTSEGSFVGSYAAPPGPDWGWRIVLRPGQERFEIVMHNIFPDGQEEVAVEADFSRRNSA